MRTRSDSINAIVGKVQVKDAEFRAHISKELEKLSDESLTAFADYAVGSQPNVHGEIITVPNLQPSEMYYLGDDKRCERCGHLGVFHHDDMGIETCVVYGCRCEEPKEESGA